MGYSRWWPAMWVLRSVAILLVVVLLSACGRSVPAPVIQGTSARNLPAGSAAMIGNSAAVIVQPNDTLYAIARRNRVSLRALIDVNRLRPPYLIQPGQTLRLPKPRFHAVARGDTVYGVSRAYGVEISQLVRLNGLHPPYTISVGQRLNLPGAVRPTPRVSANTRVANEQPAVARRSAAPAPQGVPRIRPVRIAKKSPVPPPPPRAGSKFAWPTRGKIISGFGPKKGGYHNDGINILVAADSPVLAAENGVVTYAGNELRGYGNLLLVRHDGGWITAYAHNSKLLVSHGQRINRGQMIARAGSTGGVERSQLHFEIRKGAKPVNPVRYLPTG